MRVLITQRQMVDKYGVSCDMLESSYVEYFQELNLVPFSVSNFCKPSEYLLDKIDVLVLTGGGDIPLSFYDNKNFSNEQPQRDSLEKYLFYEALKKGIKILGICRGMQFINGLLGGKVSKLENLSVERPVGQKHKVLMSGQEIVVNNFHNDGIYKKNLAQGLDVLAEDIENGVIEAFVGKNILGLQWHPERFGDDFDAKEQTKKIITDFIKGDLK